MQTESNKQEETRERNKQKKNIKEKRREKQKRMPKLTKTQKCWWKCQQSLKQQTLRGQKSKFLQKNQTKRERAKET